MNINPNRNRCLRLKTTIIYRTIQNENNQIMTSKTNDLFEPYSSFMTCILGTSKCRMIHAKIYANPHTANIT